MARFVFLMFHSQFNGSTWTQSDFRTQWETTRGRVSLFNLTTEPVSWLLLPLWHFICSVTAVPWCKSRDREVHCSATINTRQHHDPWTRTFVIWHACEGNPMPGSEQPIMEQQAWILRSILTQLESQEAADEGAPNCISGEFAVSQL